MSLATAQLPLRGDDGSAESAFIQLRDANGGEGRIALRGIGSVIGREPESDVVLESTTVSRRHALISSKGKGDRDEWHSVKHILTNSTASAESDAAFIYHKIAKSRLTECHSG